MPTVMSAGMMMHAGASVPMHAAGAARTTMRGRQQRARECDCAHEGDEKFLVVHITPSLSV